MWVNVMLLKSSLLIKQKWQDHLEVDGRYVAVNVATSAISARMTNIFEINRCILFLTIKYISFLFNIGDNNIQRHL